MCTFYIVILNLFQDPLSGIYDTYAVYRIPCRQSRRGAEGADYNLMPRAALLLKRIPHGP